MSQPERRRVERTKIQEIFSMFLVIPEKQGMAKIYMKDLSKIGVCFRRDADIEYAANEKIDLRLYTSPTFYLPVTGMVVRIADTEIGIEFDNTQSKSMRALVKLMEFLALAQDAIIQTK